MVVANAVPHGQYFHQEGYDCDASVAILDIIFTINCASNFSGLGDAFVCESHLNYRPLAIYQRRVAAPNKLHTLKKERA